MSPTPPAWIRDSRPPAPPELGPWLAGAPGGAARPGAESLTDAAEDALVRALATEGRPGAFHLLAADALLTWASEAALDEDRPAETLARMAARIAGAPHAGPGSVPGAGG